MWLLTIIHYLIVSVIMSYFTYTVLCEVTSHDEDRLPIVYNNEQKREHDKIIYTMNKDDKEKSELDIYIKNQLVKVLNTKP